MKIVRKKIPNKVRALLQKENNSQCPFCDNDEVGVFEVHHIDENPGNNDYYNLILVCPNCHAKITNGDIKQFDVLAKKTEILTYGEINKHRNKSGKSVCFNSSIENVIVGNNNIRVYGNYINTDRISQNTKVMHDPDKHITNAQAKEIRDRVQKIAESRSRESKYSFPRAYIALHNRYNITSYELLSKDQYEDAIKWLDKQIAIYRPKLKKVDNEQYRKDMYKSIHARANQLNVNIHEFASSALELKNPISSLTELSDTRLKKLYRKLYSIKIK
jgi:hypothetical protein